MNEKQLFPTDREMNELRNKLGKLYAGLDYELKNAEDLTLDHVRELVLVAVAELSQQAVGMKGETR